MTSKEFDKQISKPTSASRFTKIQDEIRASSPGLSPIIYEDDNTFIVRRPVTYGSVSKIEKSNKQFIKSNSKSLLNIKSVEKIKKTGEWDEEDGDGETGDLRMVQNRYRYYGKLDPSRQNSLIMPAHVLPEKFHERVSVSDSNGKKQHSLITIFSVWNTMMGTSILSIPWAIGQSGFITGIIILFLMAFITLYTAHLIVKCQKNIGLPNSSSMGFSEIAFHYMGYYGQVPTLMFSLITLLSASIVYWILMSNFLYYSVDFVYEKSFHHFNESNNSGLDVYCSYKNISQNESKENVSFLFHPIKFPEEEKEKNSLYKKIWNLRYSVPFYLLIILFPLINIKSPTFFTKFTALGTISIFNLLIFITVKSFSWGFHLNLSDPKAPFYSENFKWSFPTFTGVLSLAYFIHNAILDILRNNKHQENNGRDLAIAYMLVLFTFTYVGILFYSSIPLDKSCIADNLLNNMVSSDIYSFITRSFLFCQIVTVFPLLIFIFRSQFMTAFFNKIYPNAIYVLMMNAVIVTICIFFAVFYPHIGSILRYLGSVSGLGYIFALPSIVYILQLKAHNQLNPVILFIHIIIVILGFINCIVQFFI